MILIGIKRTEAGGTFHGVDGLEGFSTSGTNISIIKEGTKEELIDFIDKTEKELKIAKEHYLNLVYELDHENPNLSYDDYEKSEIEYERLRGITNFDTKIIVEGFII
jgi:hypothetical protein